MRVSITEGHLPTPHSFDPLRRRLQHMGCLQTRKWIALLGVVLTNQKKCRHAHVMLARELSKQHFSGGMTNTALAERVTGLPAICPST